VNVNADVDGDANVDADLMGAFYTRFVLCFTRRITATTIITITTADRQSQ